MIEHVPASERAPVSIPPPTAVGVDERPAKMRFESVKRAMDIAFALIGLILDMKIIVSTVPVVLLRRGAY
jgi:lipopolysaccharide/colanic/teichoic acid biosynthesis glycosyltransferase